MQLIPVYEHLAAHARCWWCHIEFGDELYYVLIDDWATCVGCAIASRCFGEPIPTTPTLDVFPLH